MFRDTLQQSWKWVFCMGLLACVVLATGIATLASTRPKSCDRFIVLSQQRSGSGFVVDVLNSHPEMACADEIFTSAKGIDRGDWDEMEQAMDATFESLCSGFFSRPKAVGFKWMMNQGHALQHDKFRAYALARPGVKLVYLFRRNLLRREISHRVNTAVGGHRLAHPSTEEVVAKVRSAKTTVPIDEKLIKTFVARLEERATVVEWYEGIPSIYVGYEDLAAPHHDAAAWGRLWHFLGVTPSETDTSLKVIHNDRPILEAVENAPAVYDTMRWACNRLPDLDVGGGACTEVLGDEGCACDGEPCPCSFNVTGEKRTDADDVELDEIGARYAAAGQALAFADALATGIGVRAYRTATTKLRVELTNLENALTDAESKLKDHATAFDATPHPEWYRDQAGVLEILDRIEAAKPVVSRL